MLRFSRWHNATRFTSALTGGIIDVLQSFYSIQKILKEGLSNTERLSQLVFATNVLASPYPLTWYSQDFVDRRSLRPGCHTRGIVERMRGLCGAGSHWTIDKIQETMFFSFHEINLVYRPDGSLHPDPKSQSEAPNQRISRCLVSLNVIPAAARLVDVLGLLVNMGASQKAGGRMPCTDIKPGMNPLWLARSSGKQDAIAFRLG